MPIPNNIRLDTNTRKETKKLQSLGIVADYKAQSQIKSGRRIASQKNWSGTDIRSINVFDVSNDYVKLGVSCRPVYKVGYFCSYHFHLK
jgi:hypothetical protein